MSNGSVAVRGDGCAGLLAFLSTGPLHGSSECSKTLGRELAARWANSGEDSSRGAARDDGKRFCPDARIALGVRVGFAQSETAHDERLGRTTTTLTEVGKTCLGWLMRHSR